MVSLGLHGAVVAAGMSMLSPGGGEEGSALIGGNAGVPQISLPVRIQSRPAEKGPEPLPTTFAAMPPALTVKPPDFSMPDDPAPRRALARAATAQTSMAHVLLPRPNENIELKPNAKQTSKLQAQDAPPGRAAASRSAKAVASRSEAAEADGASGYFGLRTVTYAHRGKAVYPADALRKAQTGTVRLLLYINERGAVDRVEIAQSSGFPSLDAAAAAAEKKSLFHPAVIDGKPVKTKVIVPYTFRLR